MLMQHGLAKRHALDQAKAFQALRPKIGAELDREFVVVDQPA